MSTVEKLDLKRVLKEFYSPPAKKMMLVDVPEFTFLTQTGMGDPNSATAFGNAVSALYTLAYTLKFMLKAEGKTQDFTVMPLEAIWWVDGGTLSPETRSEWQWRAQILQPDFVTEELLEEARKSARAKKPEVAVDSVQLLREAEGICAQALHIGSYAEEKSTIEQMVAFAAQQGYVPAGRHHEIYMSDPARTAPAKLRTVLRQPVRKV